MPGEMLALVQQSESDLMALSPYFAVAAGLAERQE